MPEPQLDTNTLFAEIVLPIPVAKKFTYRVPTSLSRDIKKGQRAIVQFGSKKILTGIVFSLTHAPPREYEAKSILDIPDEYEIIFDQQFTFYQWIAEYYMCTLGEVIHAAIPSGLKLSSESMAQLHPEFNFDHTPFEFSAKEQILLERLHDSSLSYTEISKILETKNLFSILKSLVSKEAIILFEEVKEKYKPKTERRVRLHKQYLAKEQLEALFQDLSAKPKQEAVLLRYLQDVPVFSNADLNDVGVAKLKLTSAELSASSLQTLLKNNVFEEFEKIVPRYAFSESITPPPLLLSEQQQQARNALLSQLENHQAALLHGVTGSGKTEIYIDLIRRALDGGNQVLYLLPEIALTTQIVQRLKKVFGADMGVYHSRFSDNERVEVWNGLLTGKCRFIVGVRSSIFLPFDNLGLIIVDEEHDASYKQTDIAPRYHARDASLMLAQIHHAKVVLGSATPSVETYYQAMENRYGLVSLGERFGESQLPEIRFANLLKERQQKTNQGEFSLALLSAIKDCLAKKEQVILFQNRRGYSPMVQCEDCNWVPKCINCAVSLTYHQYRHAMVCHYCGYKEALPNECPTCSSRRLLTLGYGTEKLEEELHLHFPDSMIQRMDWDTTRTKSSYESIIDAFASGDMDILVGTQMVTKGLDFNHVGLVGIFNADRMMHFPDFRSHERAFQLILQVSGRAGRREKRGRVIVQTSNPEHPLFHFVVEHDVDGFLKQQLMDRNDNLYPPYSRLIEVVFKHKDAKVCRETSEVFTQQARDSFGALKIMGPGQPIVSRIRNEYLMTTLFKIGRNSGKLNDLKLSLQAISDQLHTEKRFRNTKIVFDVDPV